MADARICNVEGCEKPRHAHGYCARHAYHFKAHGDPLGGSRGASPGEPLAWIIRNANYDGDDCLRWPHDVTSHGYGVVRRGGKRRVASRVMCEVAHGPPPTPEHEAAHSCGNGHQGCMNWRHLSWKTHAENVGDAITHGTWVRGERAPASKLTEDQVRDIRRRAGSMLQRELAAEYGVGQDVISKIINRKLWAWLD